MDKKPEKNSAYVQDRNPDTATNGTKESEPRQDPFEQRIAAIGEQKPAAPEEFENSWTSKNMEVKWDLVHTKETNAHGAKESKSTKDSKKATDCEEVETTSPGTSSNTLTTEEEFTKLAKDKFDAQEGKLKEIAKKSMALLGHFHSPKLGSVAEVQRRVAEIRKCLWRYDNQVWVWQKMEDLRRLEIEELEKQAKCYKDKALMEACKMNDLQIDLERECKRRKRYEHYESLAKEVNEIKSRPELRLEIEAANADIEKLKKKKKELDAQIDKRNECLRVAKHVADNLKLELETEQQLIEKATNGELSKGHAQLLEWN